MRASSPRNPLGRSEADAATMTRPKPSRASWHMRKGAKRIWSRQRRPSTGSEEQEAERGQENDGSSGDSSVQKQAQPSTSNPSVEHPRIQPGERLRDFAARVDQALPVAGLAKKGNQKVPGIKERRTKLEKRITRMQDDWRKDEARIVEKEEEERELADDQEEDRAAEYGEEYREVMLQTGKKGKKRRLAGEQTGKEEDPWAVLKSKREKPKGLHDVVQAPPQFNVVPKEKFKVKNGATAKVVDVPSAAGSLRRREELGAERKNIIERYRQLMSNKRQDE